MYTVYVIKSLLNGKLYTGFTEDISSRLKAHNAGKVRATKTFKPYELIYREEFVDKKQARRRELFLKSGQGRKQLKFVLDGCPSG